MMTNLAEQRSDYTFKYNKKLGRHGWLRLTPAYSVKLVEELVIDTPKETNILDPFSGTGTTGLCASEQGMNALLFDINPFLVWFGNTKLKDFSKDELSVLTRKVEAIVQKFPKRVDKNNWVPDIHNIERWWCADTLPLVAGLRQEIVATLGEPNKDEYANLVWISFCRLIIETSSAAFNHVSMSFKGELTSYGIGQIAELFLEIYFNILEGANKELIGKSEVKLIDSREPIHSKNKIGHVITSPPYPNRMSYIRELRPYMYWTKFLDSAREAGELDWKAIGGTWGVASSRLKDWSPNVTQLPQKLISSCEGILSSGGKNSDLMARYVHKYFNDMHLHFASLRGVLDDGAKLDYVVGNSTFYGVSVPSEHIYEESLESLGYQDIKSRIVRKRNSKKELYEYCVEARWTK